jgi:hypothetical protein
VDINFFRGVLANVGQCSIHTLMITKVLTQVAITIACKQVLITICHGVTQPT